MHSGRAAVENSMMVPQETKQNYHLIQLSYFWIYAKKNWNRTSNRYLYVPVPSSIAHNSQKMKTTQINVNQWINKQNVLYTYN